MMLNQNELVMLSDLSQAMGLSQADVLRTLLHQRHADFFEHRQLRLGILALLKTMGRPMQPSDFVGHLGGKLGVEYVQWNVNKMLDKLVSEGVIKGDIHNGYTLV